MISPDVYGSGSGTILLDNVQCSDLSVELADCDHQPWGDHDCDHRDDVGVDCNPGKLDSDWTNISCCRSVVF